MFSSLSPPHRVRTIILLGLAVALGAVAAVVGVDDYAPGIIAAVLAGTALVTAFVHHWRAPKQFLKLAAWSLLVVLVSAAVGIAIDIAISAQRLPGPIAPALEWFGGTLFLAIAFVGVPAILVGLVGALLAWFARGRLSRAS